MTATFRLGRFAGVDIGVHWSVLIIFGLLTWILSGSAIATPSCRT